MEIYELAVQLGVFLRGKKLRLAAAESCTGGWIAKAITDVPGSSEWFERGFVTYSNLAKQQQLGVSADILRAHGAVSEATVRSMVEGAIRNSDAGLAVAVSGIAGPDGGTVEKPVGSVWLAWGGRQQETKTHFESFSGDRDAIRRAAVITALREIIS